MQSISAAAIQMVSSPDVAENLRQVAALIDRAASAGAKLIVLPEYFAIMGLSDKDKLAQQEPFKFAGAASEPTPLQDFLAQQAQQHGIWLVGGTIPLQSGQVDKVMNTCLAFNPQGECVARYDKVHLFGFANGSECFQESDTISPGALPVAFDTPFGRVGLAVCYDIRFPEFFRALQHVGTVDIWAIPAAFTATTGRAHWEVLLRARAIENQCFIIASGQGGTHASGRTTYGHSMLIDPWGAVLAVWPEGEGVVSAELKASQLQRVRTILPALKHRVF
ncbi:carbon-nitrogen hydrolase family protein [Chitinibacter bivalviorum]|uniref:Carbon-nitrogen hydrolase family protein n=1 Tax=Chitinibacter bivalviorum TaxID=2739434 RepID=A0A7H9BG43_9NEIS|nr:carbon-nitrogen hydrolase family protein [Chitinibacter bivalviorum]QLG87178.1 carbon-nitrogen hydrolase family protein [Chitinibacter bivalviorum]